MRMVKSLKGVEGSCASSRRNAAVSLARHTSLRALNKHLFFLCFVALWVGGEGGLEGVLHCHTCKHTHEELLTL